MGETREPKMGPASDRWTIADAYIWIIRAWTHIVNKTNKNSFYNSQFVGNLLMLLFSKMDLRDSPLFMIDLVCNIQRSHQHHIKDEFSQMHLWNGITAFKYRAYGRDSLARSFRNPGIAKRGPGYDTCHDSSSIFKACKLPIVQLLPNHYGAVTGRKMLLLIASWWIQLWNTEPNCCILLLISALLLTFRSCI